MSLTVTAPPRIRPRLECGLAVEFGGGRPLPVVADYLEALRASRSLYGQESDLSPVAAGWGNPYGSMAESVVSGLGLRRDDAGQDSDPDGLDGLDGPDDRAVDTAIIAYDGMDCGPREHLGCRLTEVTRGRPRAFAVSGQGEAGPFTAMRIAATLVSSGSARRVLVLMLEHGQVPLDGGLPAPAADVAVGFVVGTRGPVSLAGVEVRPADREQPESEPAAGSGLTAWAELAGSLSQGIASTLRLTDPAFGYRCELRVAP